MSMNTQSIREIQHGSQQERCYGIKDTVQEKQEERDANVTNRNQLEVTGLKIITLKLNGLNTLKGRNR